MMAEVLLHIGGYHYQVACGDGEEQALNRLGNLINEQIESARLMTGNLTETRQLLFAAILLADKLLSAQDSGVTAAPPRADGESANVPAIHALTVRIAALAARIEGQG